MHRPSANYYLLLPNYSRCDVRRAQAICYLLLTTYQPPTLRCTSCTGHLLLTTYYLLLTTYRLLITTYHLPTTHVAMYLVHRGMALFLGRVLTTGSLWGEDVVLLHSTHLHRAFSASAMSYLEVFSIARARLAEVVRHFPVSARHLRKCAIRLALRREVVFIAKARKKLKFPTHYLLLTTHYSLLTIYYLLLTTMSYCYVLLLCLTAKARKKLKSPAAARGLRRWSLAPTRHGISPSGMSPGGISPKQKLSSSTTQSLSSSLSSSVCVLPKAHVASEATRTRSHLSCSHELSTRVDSDELVGLHVKVDAMQGQLDRILELLSDRSHGETFPEEQGASPLVYDV